MQKAASQCYVFCYLPSLESICLWMQLSVQAYLTPPRACTASWEWGQPQRSPRDNICPLAWGWALPALLGRHGSVPAILQAQVQVDPARWIKARKEIGCQLCCCYWYCPFPGLKTHPSLPHLSHPHPPSASTYWHQGSFAGLWRMAACGLAIWNGPLLQQQ